VTWRFLSFLPLLPPAAEVVGGTQIRPSELFRRCSERGHRVRVLETDNPEGAPRSEGLVEIGPLTTRRRGAVGLAQRILEMRRVLRDEARAAASAGERLCYYAKLPTGFVFKRGVLPAPTHPGALLLPLARKLGAVTWAAVHDLSPDHERQMLLRADAWSRTERRQMEWKARLGAFSQRQAFRHASFLSAVSPPLLETLRRRYSLDPRRLAVFWSGVAPHLVEPIPAWEPPLNRPWRVGYLGSPFDVSFELLARSLRALGRDDVVLVLGGLEPSRHAERARAIYPRLEVVDGIRYQGYAAFAERIDLWALPFDDPYCLQIAWQLKVPLALASGRPFVRSRGPVVETSDLAPYMGLGGTSPESFAAALQSVMEDPQSAKERAATARAEVLRRYTWDVLCDGLLERLEEATRLAGP
jgi:glycosyltransferase involved in cell wall biosynthesis